MISIMMLYIGVSILRTSLSCIKITTYTIIVIPIHLVLILLILFTNDVNIKENVFVYFQII